MRADSSAVEDGRGLRVQGVTEWFLISSREIICICIICSQRFLNGNVAESISFELSANKNVQLYDLFMN